VAHLENHRKLDKDNALTLHKAIENASSSINNLTSLVRELSEGLEKQNERLNSCERAKLNIADFDGLLSQTITRKKFARDTDVENLKDLINSLANDTHHQMDSLQNDAKRQEAIINDIQDKLTSQPTESKGPHVTCFGADQSSRISALELKQSQSNALAEAVASLRSRVNTLEEGNAKTSTAIAQLDDEKGRRTRNFDNLTSDLDRLNKQLGGLRADMLGMSRTLSQDLAPKLDQLMTTRPDRQQIEEIVRDKFEEYLQEYPIQPLISPPDSSKMVTREEVDKLMDFTRGVEQRLLLLATECRDGLEFLQGYTDKKIEILAKWFEKNINEFVSSKAAQDRDLNTDVGVRCLACATPVDAVYPGSKNLAESNSMKSRPTSANRKEPVFRLSVPASLRQTVGYSREDGHEGNNHDTEEGRAQPDDVPIDNEDNYFAKLSPHIPTRKSKGEIMKGLTSRPTSGAGRKTKKPNSQTF
jgi:CRISPR/Cas system CSM-associated protein Csm2 small subunit